VLVSIVVIAAENDAIGKGNQLLCHLPDDLKHFKAVTMGKPVVMGRKTYESIGKPLPGRPNIVVTRQRNLAIPGCIVVDSIESAVRAAGDAPEICMIGGAELYRQALPLTHRIYLTRIHAQLDGDVFFPALTMSEWRETHREPHPADERHAYSFTFTTLERAS
jgi:dihydrofolate reductase